MTKHSVKWRRRVLHRANDAKIGAKWCAARSAGTGQQNGSRARNEKKEHSALFRPSYSQQDHDIVSYHPQQQFLGSSPGVVARKAEPIFLLIIELTVSACQRWP